MTAADRLKRTTTIKSILTGLIAPSRKPYRTWYKMKALEIDYGHTAPGNYLIGGMIKYYSDKHNPDFWDARSKSQNTITARTFAHIRLDLVYWRLEVRYNFKTGRRTLMEVFNDVRRRARG